MKIRNTKIKTYEFYPSKKSKLENKGLKYFSFKTKKSLMDFLNGNLSETINGRVDARIQTLSSYYTERTFFVWYNEHEWRYRKTNKIKIVLKQELFRGRKCIMRHFISKEDKKYFALSDKRINLMSHISQYGINKAHAKNLMKIFYASGWKDFELDEHGLEYMKGNIDDIPWGYWCDRCNFLRMKVIYEYFKRENLC